MNGCIDPGKTLQQPTVCLPIIYVEMNWPLEFGIAVDFWN